MTAGFPGRAEEPPAEPGPVPSERGAAVPLGMLDPATIHRARAVNANALRAMDGVLDQIADRPDRP